MKISRDPSDVESKDGFVLVRARDSAGEIFVDVSLPGWELLQKDRDPIGRIEAILAEQREPNRVPVELTRDGKRILMIFL